MNTAEFDFPAEMTRNQFEALSIKLEQETLIEELRDLPYLNTLCPAPSARFEDIGKWLVNGWNTELIIRSNLMYFSEEQLIHALQWAFPQAYYSVFAVTQAFFRSVGFTQARHNAIIKKIGQLMAEENYPASLSMLADGGMRNIRFQGVRKFPTEAPICFDPADASSVDTQICQFLKATRELSLGEKAKQMKFKTRTGKPKQCLGRGEWEKVSDALGLTSIFSLLYRKRIKSNYKQIGTFLNPRIDPVGLHQHLAHIVWCVNLVHEAFLVEIWGIDRVMEVGEFLDHDFIQDRMEIVQSIFGNK